MKPIDFQVIFSDLSRVINTIYVITIIFIILLIILENRSPLKSVSWIIVVTLIPVFGIVFYFFFGQRYRKERKYTRKEARYRKHIKNESITQLKNISAKNFPENDPVLSPKKNIMTLLLRNNNSLITRNKTVKILTNGEETFPDLLSELKKAEKHIHLEFFIFKFDNIGNKILDILKQKAREGIEVRVLYDSVGSYYMPHHKKREAKKAGIQLKSFQKVIFPFLSSKVNYRNHRKLVIIDGKIGYTGGLNVSDKYLENIPHKKYWRDTFVKIEGEAAASLQAIFINDWYYVTKNSIYNEKYFPKFTVEKGVLAQIISSGPDNKLNTISQFYFSAITSAQKYIYITTPYFMPTDEISYALKAAAMKGVDLRIIIPKKSDTPFSQWAGISYVEEMLKAGVKIYQYTKGFCHNKIIVTDDMLSSVGSANLDYRSLETHFEVNAVFYDKVVAQKLSMQFLEDLKTSDEIKLDAWKNRPWYIKAVSSFARLFVPVM
jgi:cardiolipin synthase